MCDYLCMPLGFICALHWVIFDNPGLACQDAGAPDEEDPAAADLAFLEELAEQQ